MNKSVVTKTFSSSHGIKLLSLMSTMASLLGTPVVAWTSPTLVSDSYVSSPFVSGVRHGSDTLLRVNRNNTGFIKFSLAKSFPAGTTDADIERATLKLFVSEVNTAGTLTIRRVNQRWGEPTIPAAGVSPVLDLVTPAQTFKISKAYKGHWVLFDITDLVKGWASVPTSNNGIALIVGKGSLLDAAIDSKENTTTSHQAVLDVVLDTKGITGATGPRGATGAKGDTGAVGPKGATGAVGPKGAKGATGAVGPKGAKGATGAVGPKGAKGATGAVGPKGARGATGAQGAVGAQGATGANGAQGATGANGAQGATGANGVQGATGANGAQGATGANGAQGATGANGVQGATGANGAQGATGANGATGASGAMGYQRVTGPTSADDANAKTATADCPSGKKVIGGGYVISGTAPGGLIASTPVVLDSRAIDDDTWAVDTTNSTDLLAGLNILNTLGLLNGLLGDKTYAVTAYAVCIIANP